MLPVNPQISIAARPPPFLARGHLRALWPPQPAAPRWRRRSGAAVSPARLRAGGLGGGRATARAEAAVGGGGRAAIDMWGFTGSTGLF